MEFCLQLQTDRYEPVFRNGDVIALTEKKAGQNEIGIFLVNEVYYLRLLYQENEEKKLKALNVLVPGGMPGTLNLKEHEGLRNLIGEFDKKKKYLAAICAAPSILSELGILKGRKACAYPSFEEGLDCAQVVHEAAVTDGHVTTGRGMGAAIPFALKLTELLCGTEKANEIAESIVYA